MYYLCRLKLPLVVQDSTGSVSLTVFDREASKILNTSAKALVDKHTAVRYYYDFVFYINNFFDNILIKCYIKQGGDNAGYPEELNDLVGKKFAFRIDISEFNQKNNFWVFGVSKVIDDADIICELKKKSNNSEVIHLNQNIFNKLFLTNKY